jgi:hypothetical protein
MIWPGDILADATPVAAGGERTNLERRVRESGEAAPARWYSPNYDLSVGLETAIMKLRNDLDRRRSVVSSRRNSFSGRIGSFPEI